MCSGLCFESKLQQATKGFKVNLQLLQVSNTFLNILAVPNNAVFWTCPVLKSIPIFSIHLSNSFDTAPNAPITTGMTVTFFMPHIVATSLFKSPYFSIYSCSFVLTRESYGTSTSMIWHSFASSFTTTMSGLLASIS